MFYLSENALHNGIFLSFPNDPHLAVIRSVIAFYQRKTLSVLIIWLKRTTLFNPVVKLVVKMLLLKVALGSSEVNLHKHLLSSYDKTVR